MRSIIVILAAATGLAGCATIPKGVGQMPVTPAQLYRAATCEIAAVLADETANAAFIKSWVAVIDITITRDNTDEFQPGLTFEGPIGGSDVTASPGATFGHTRNGQAVSKYKIPEVKNLSGIADCVPTSGLGLQEKLAEMTRLVAAEKARGIIAGDFIFTATFTANHTVSGGLVFKFDQLTVGLNGNSLSRTDTNTVSVALKPASPTAAPGSSQRTKALNDAQQLLDDNRTLQTLQQSLGL